MNVLCFGEPLIRLATSAHERLEIARDLEISYAGAETVVAISLALQGESVSYATKLASNRLGTNALMTDSRRARQARWAVLTAAMSKGGVPH